MNISKVKIERFLAMALCVVASVLLFSPSALAQDDKGRDRRDSRDRDLEREKWKQKFDLKGYLHKLDDDKNGVLEGKELKSDRTRHFLSSMGINVDGPVKVETAIKKAESTYANKRDAERKKFEDQVGPKLNSFGTATETIGLDGFGAAESKEPVVATFDESLTGLKMSDFDERTLSDARKTLEGYDRDKSGFLEGDEIKRVRWKDPSPSESDLNNDGRLSLLEMAKRKSDSRAKKSDGGDDRRDRGDDRRGRDYDSKDRDYGRNNRDYDRGRRPDKSSYGRSNEAGRSSAYSSSSSRSSREESSTRSASADSAFANYIDGVYKKYDTDGDKRLSQAELKKMRRPLKGDTNSDGFLSKEEATNYIKDDKSKNKSNAKVTPAVTGDDAADGGRGSTERSPGNVASRRRTPSKNSAKSSGGAKSRGSLGSMDANKDGQIQMAEFSKTWDEATLQKFRKTDTDHDGIISADEWSSSSK